MKIKKVLAWLTTHFPAYRLANKPIQTFYRFILAPLVKLLFLSLFPNRIQTIRFRHSLLEKEFDWIFSDIDYTIVIKDHLSSKKIEKIVCVAVGLRKLLPMFDLPEVYTETENHRKQELLESEAQPLIRDVWHLRKLAWEAQKYNHYTQQNLKYDAKKSKRALKKSLNFLNQDDTIQFPLEINLAMLNSASQLVSKHKRKAAYSFYAMFYEQPSPWVRWDTLEGHAFLYLIFCPHAQIHDSSLEQERLNLLGHYSCYQQWLEVLAEYEWLTLWSVERTQKGFQGEQVFYEWRTKLENIFLGVPNVRHS